MDADLVTSLGEIFWLTCKDSAINKDNFLLDENSIDSWLHVQIILTNQNWGIL